MEQKKREETLAILKASGFRATKSRIAVLLLLEKAGKPLSIREIVGRLTGEKIDQVTVYRMVEAFVKKGILREVNLRGDHPRYELQDEHDHHHIVCTSCERVEDFVDSTHENIEKRVLAKSKSFKQITGHSFDLYGLCKACSK
jgi:Fur family ferric uptake transcriptional regulator